MKLRFKIHLQFFVLLLSCSLMVGLTINFLIDRGFNELQRQEVNTNIARLENAFDHRLSALDGQLADWSIWDDSYEFALTGNPEFVENEVTAGLLRQLDVDAVAHTDFDGGLLSSRFLREDADEWDERSAVLLGESVSSIVAKREGAEGWTGVVTPNGLPAMLVSVRALYRSDGSGPPSGWASFVRVIDGDLAKELSDDVQLTVVGVAVKDVASIGDADEVYGSVLNNGSRAVRDLSDDTSAGYWLVKDFQGEPVILYRVEVPRTIYEYGRRMMLFLMAMLLLTILLSLLAMNLLFGRTVVLPIERISKAVRGLAEGGRMDVEFSGDDEIAFLGREIKTRVKEIQNAERDIGRHADELKKYKLAIDNVSDMIVIANPEMRIVYANPASASVSGYGSDELIGRDAAEVWSSGDQAMAARIGLALSRGDGVTLDGVAAARKEGERYIAEIRIFAVNDEKGEPAYFIGLTRDVTKAKELEQVKTEFVSVASHQLKSPLTSIKWLTELMMEDKKRLKKGQREAITQLYEVNERLIRLVNDLLNVSRIDSGRKFSVDKKSTEVIALIGQVITEQSIIAAQRGISVSLAEGTPDALEVPTDSVKIQQVFSNLINNAIKYSGSGGGVIVHVEDGASEVMFSVADSGIGIPAEDQPRIFDKFYRAGNIGDIEGTGLGMYIVRAIVEKHGGRIWFDSKEGVGTTFRFTLPKG